MTLFAGLDIGTSGGRCLIVDEHGRRVSIGARRWRYVADEDGFPTLDPDSTIVALADATAEALSGCDPNDLVAIGVTSQRTGIALIDDEGIEISVSPNADGRGAQEGIAMERAHGARIYEISGRLPVLIYAPARLAWYARNKPEVRARVRAVLSLSDWVVWRLTGVMATEATQAAEMLLYDVARGEWSQELLDLFAVERALLPAVRAAGERAGTAEAMDFGLPADVVVVAAGADTQCAALGMGVIDPGAAIVVAGTTMLCEQVVEDATTDPAGRLWTSPHAIEGRFVREAHCGESGAVFDWIDGLFGAAPGTLAELSEAAAPGAGGVAFIDAHPSVASDFAMVRRGALVFNAPVLALGRGRGEIARAVVEGTAFGAREGLRWLEESCGPPTSVAVAGGMTLSEPFVAALAGAAERPLRVATEPSTTALGAAIAAAAGHVGEMRAAADAMHDRGREVTPDAAHGYPALYETWRKDVEYMNERALRVSHLTR